MKKYRVIAPVIVVEAVQFDPHAAWHDCVHSWEKEEARPRDTSWGYIQTDEVKTHVLAGDWIVKDGVGNLSVGYSEIIEHEHKWRLQINCACGEVLDQVDILAIAGKDINLERIRHDLISQRL